MMLWFHGNSGVYWGQSSMFCRLSSFLQIEVPAKIYLYWLIYPVFMYSWVPVTFLGWIHRHEKQWVHTIHTRSMQFQAASLTRKKEIDS